MTHGRPWTNCQRVWARAGPVRNSHNASIWQVLPRSIQMMVMKETEEEEFWTRLLKDKIKEKGQCAIDWDKYIDEVGGRTHPCSQRACARMDNANVSV